MGHSSVLALAAARMSEIVPARSSTGFCIGCSNATNGQIPWQAPLQTTGHFCGASIISSTFLNCAAHCKKSSFTANVGDVDNTKGQRISAKKFIAHPRYNGNLIIKDYGVIELSSPITINEFAKPIPLITAGPRPADRTPLMTSGYGYYEYDSSGLRPNRKTSRYLKFTDIEYVSVARCKQAWAGRPLTSQFSVLIRMVPLSAPVILADPSSTWSTVNIISSEPPHGLTSTAPLTTDLRDGTTFTRLNTTSGFATTLISKYS